MEILKTIREAERKRKVPKPPNAKKGEYYPASKSVKAGQALFNAFSITTACLSVVSYAKEDTVILMVGILVVGILAVLLEKYKNEGISQIFDAYFSWKRAEKSGDDTDSVKQKEDAYDAKVYGLWPIAISVLLSFMGIMFMNKDSATDKEKDMAAKYATVSDSLKRAYTKKLDSLGSVGNGAEVMKFVKTTYKNLFDDKAQIEGQLEIQNGFAPSRQDRRLIAELNQKLETVNASIESARKERIVEVAKETRAVKTEMEDALSSFRVSSEAGEDANKEELQRRMSYGIIFLIEGVIVFIGYSLERSKSKYIEERDTYYNEVKETKAYINYDKDCSFIESLYGEYEIGDKIPDADLASKYIDTYGRRKDVNPIEEAKKKLIQCNVLVEAQELKKKAGRGRASNVTVHRLSSTRAEAEKYLRGKYGQQLQNS